MTSNRFFLHFPMQPVTSTDLDAALEANQRALAILFLWGRHCPNCDIAKQSMLDAQAMLQWSQVQWLHGNVTDDPQLGVRFGLHGIPGFVVFHGSRKLGRISAWPGPTAFVEAIAQQIAQLNQPADI